MSRNRRNPRWTWAAMAAALALVSVGCGDSSSSAELAGPSGSGGAEGDRGAAGAGGTEADGGLGVDAPVFDAGAEGLDNNPIEMLFAGSERNPWDFLATDAQDSQSYVDAAVSCFGTADACGSNGCEAFASCCVASGSCCEPIVDEAPLPASLAFGSCAGGSVQACAATAGVDAEVFGAVQPVLTGRGLVPNGGVTSDGGALLGELVNLASLRVLAEVQFSLPIDCGGTCLESAGVAFTPSSEQAEFSGAGLGLLLSGSREEVSLMIGGQVADRFHAGNDRTVWSLEISPEGRVEVARDGSALGAYTFDSASLSRARLAVFGRNLGADSTAATISRVAFEAEICDTPSAWTERFPMLVTWQSQPEPAFMSGRAPSIADGPVTKLAFELDGEVFLGEQVLPAQLELDSSSPALFPTESYEAGGVGDPELVWSGDTLYVFYTARDAQGVTSIGAARAVQDVFTEKNPAPVLAPDGDALAYDSPTVTVRDGLWLMVARARLSSGATELRAFYSYDPETSWERVVDGTLEALSRVEDPTTEITEPSLVVHNSAYQLYYARRTGTRWTIELAVSDELLIWRPLGEVLGGSGEGFDSLGTRSPDAISRPDRVDLVYSGQDGVSFDLGYASRPAPSSSAPSVF